jgi:hypothetical protein
MQDVIKIANVQKNVRCVLLENFKKIHVQLDVRIVNAEQFLNIQEVRVVIVVLKDHLQTKMVLKYVKKQLKDTLWQILAVVIKHAVRKEL